MEYWFWMPNFQRILFQSKSSLTGASPPEDLPLSTINNGSAMARSASHIGSLQRTTDKSLTNNNRGYFYVKALPLPASPPSLEQWNRIKTDDSRAKSILLSVLDWIFWKVSRLHFICSFAHPAQSRVRLWFHFVFTTVHVLSLISLSTNNSNNKLHT
jgi:hypothetical protein